jgi:microcystin-dependent protein
MSDYNLQIAWSGKDALGDSDPDKVVSGGDFNTEFLAVKTAVNSKADLANTSQVVTAATATAGTNTNQVATTAFVTAALTKATINDLAYPVGSIYTTVSSSATTPAEVNTLLGVGTWVAFGEGRVLVGKASSGTFDTINEEQGSETQTLTEANLPAHNHSASAAGSGTDAGNGNYPNGGAALYDSTSFTWNNITIGNTGSGTAHNNIQPSITVYMWKRTA